MTQKKDNSLVKEFQKVLLDDKNFLKNLMAESLQSILQDEFNRFIKAGPYERIRTQEGVVSKAVMIVIGIADSGHREILSIDIGDSENETDWGRIFKTLKERGLTGVQYVVSDDHKGLVKALQRNFQGSI